MTTNLEWDPRRALHEIGGLTSNLPTFIETARNALRPAEPRWLSDRLSTMWLAMAVGKTEAQATAWLHETQRLLMDIPSDILGPAIDEAVKASARGFMPSVGEIRAFADPRVSERRRALARLEGMQKCADDASSRPPKPNVPADPVCPPQAAAEILAEYGLKSETTRASAPTGPLRPPTADDLAEVAKAIGIKVGLSKTPAFAIEGLTTEQIFARREQLRAEAVQREAR